MSCSFCLQKKVIATYICLAILQNEILTVREVEGTDNKTCCGIGAEPDALTSGSIPSETCGPSQMHPGSVAGMTLSGCTNLCY